MPIAALLGLAGLALVDSTSLGTLVLPVLMMAHPRVRADRLLLYLGTITAFYFALGLGLLLGADVIVSTWSGLGQSRAVDVVQLVVGIVLLAVSFWPDTPWAKRSKARLEASGRPTRVERWVDAVSGDGARLGAVVVVALAAGLVEAASMVPYLGALALITTSDLGGVGQVAVLAGYVLVMVVPALMLLLLRMSARSWLDPRLAPLSRWLRRSTGGAVWWVVGIVGFLLAIDAAGRLGFGTPLVG